VSLDNISAVDLASTNTTVVRALGSWETVDWPSIGPVCQVKEGILLLETEPWLVGLVGLHELGTLVAVVELVWSSIWVPALGDNQDVGSTTEWVGEDSNRPEVDIRIVAWGLASRAAVKVPLWKVLNLEDTVLGDFGESLEKYMNQCMLNGRPLFGSAGWEHSPLTWNEHHRLSRSRCTFSEISGNPG
jgi:hypothetical protein